ncbi:hypothetical protein RF11_13049 [Thelohanellus kitauei]|uniref:Uncharacterized protein n=1 Tax=Thelohanellus kitauei TaxID=669202 RepID=A0A0C2JKA0_THEKT|nr:hypothetical protein RF11_13049 [Thelohanellus kitauei]
MTRNISFGMAYYCILKDEDLRTFKIFTALHNFSSIKFLFFDHDHEMYKLVLDHYHKSFMSTAIATLSTCDGFTLPVVNHRRTDKGIAILTLVNIHPHSSAH